MKCGSGWTSRCIKISCWLSLKPVLWSVASFWWPTQRLLWFAFSAFLDIFLDAFGGCTPTVLSWADRSRWPDDERCRSLCWQVQRCLPLQWWVRRLTMKKRPIKKDREGKGSKRERKGSRQRRGYWLAGRELCRQAGWLSGRWALTLICTHTHKLCGSQATNQTDASGTQQKRRNKERGTAEVDRWRGS